MEALYGCCCGVLTTLVYLGCYDDFGSARDLEYGPYHNESMTPWLCMQHCESLNYSYVGVQGGNECFCGHQSLNNKKVSFY